MGLQWKRRQGRCVCACICDRFCVCGCDRFCVCGWGGGTRARRACVQVGRIESSFGKTGKYKVTFPRGVTAAPGAALIMRFRKYVLAEDRALVQATA